MTKAFEIPSTPCKFVHMNVRTEKHGESNVTAVDLKFEGITLPKAMLTEFLGDKHAHDLLFVQRRAGAAIEPGLPYFEKPFKYAGKFKDCTASIRFGLQTDEHELEDVNITNIKLEPLTGGATAMTATVQYELEDTEIVATFAEYLNGEVHLGLIFGEKESPDAKKQQSLNLNTEKGPADEAASPSTH